jgi:DNA mismatch repair protein MSH5
MSQTILSVSFKHHQLGASYYSLDDATLHLSEDITENETFELIGALIFQVKPTLILVHAKIDERLLEFLQNQATVELRPSNEFNSLQGKQKLLSTRALDQDFTDEEYYFYLSSIVNLECMEMMASCGALLSYLSRVNLTGEINQAPLSLDRIVSFNLNDYVHINSDTLAALQIFNEESHPNMHNNRLKQGLSLYGILNHTKTHLGNQLLKRWLLFPLLNLESIEARQNVVAFLCKGDNLILSDQLISCLKSIRNIPVSQFKLNASAF